MTEMHVGDQTIRYDREATTAIYTGLKNGWAEDCLCVGCRNLMAQRDVVYPDAFRELLIRLGIDPNKEGEAVADGPLENGLYHYGGWFFLVGEMIAAGEQLSQVTDSPYFGYHFTRVGPCPKEFRGGPWLGVEFVAHLQWILKEPWDSDLRCSCDKHPGKASLANGRSTLTPQCRPAPGALGPAGGSASMESATGNRPRRRELDWGKMVGPETRRTLSRYISHLGVLRLIRHYSLRLRHLLPQRRMLEEL